MRAYPVLPTFIKTLNALCWVCFLALVVAISFNNTVFPSHSWWWVLSGVYGLFSISCLSLTLGDRSNIGVLVKSKTSLLLLLLMLVWIALSLVLPIPNVAYEFVESAGDGLVNTPDWYRLDRTWSFVPQKTFVFLVSEISVFVFLIVTVLLLSSRQRLMQFLILIACLGCFHAVIGIVATLYKFHLVDLKQIDGHFSAARAWFVNRNHYASFLSLSLLGSLPFFFKHFFFVKVSAKNIRPKLCYSMMLALVGFLIIMLAIILSESRSGFLASFLGLFFSLVIARKRFNKTKSLVFSSVVVSLIVLVFLITTGDHLLSRFTGQTAILGERLVQWQLTWELIQQQWFFGYGANSYADVFQLFRQDHALRPLLYNQAHNDYLHIFLELGLVGLLLYLTFLFVLLKTLIKVVRVHKDAFICATASMCIAVISAALLQSIVGFNLQVLNIRFYFFAIIAVVLVLPTMSSESPREEV